MGGMLELLKYPFCYTIRRGFGKLFGMIHVLTRHLAPELDRFRVCTYILEVLRFCRFLTNFGARNDEAHDHAMTTKKDEGQSPNKGPKAMMIRGPFVHIHPPMKPKGQSPQDKIKILRG